MSGFCGICKREISSKCPEIRGKGSGKVAQDLKWDVAPVYATMFVFLSFELGGGGGELLGEPASSHRTPFDYRASTV